MVSIQTVGSVVIKSFKLLLNLIILILYRTGYDGQLLGVGGTWNLNEDKNPDVEIVASGVFVGYFIYTSVTLIAFCFGSKEYKREPVDIIMNFVGVFMWLAVGGVAIHYWSGYQNENHGQYDGGERAKGLAVGILCVISGATYLLDTVLAVLHYIRENL
ncbi:protein snakeskin [Chrysoperla carnea]|uniref:protein snakeskin n=1 Tax=Chrysoperla carnea TaxID=189513 RepID=UPI001D090465|nr:protein snakeskin [Chrysoperla carnea]